MTELDSAEAPAAVEQLGAREVLVAEGAPGNWPAPARLRTEVDAWAFSLDYAERTLREHFHLLTLDGCGLAGRNLAVSAAGAILHYLKDTPEGRAEPSRAALLLRPGRGHGARHGHRAQPGTGRAAVHRRRRRQGLDAGRRDRPDRDRHGRPPLAAAAAAAVARSGRDRGASGRGRGDGARHHPAHRSPQDRSARCRTWNGCWPR